MSFGYRGTRQYLLPLSCPPSPPYFEVLVPVRYYVLESWTSSGLGTQGGCSYKWRSDFGLVQNYATVNLPFFYTAAPLVLHYLLADSPSARIPSKVLAKFDEAYWLFGPRKP